MNKHMGFWTGARSAVTAFAVLTLFTPQSWAADPFPVSGKTIRWIVPYTVGGSYDRLARGLAPLLGKELGVSVVVDNVPGADGYNRIYRADPDGYTIGSADPTGLFATALVRKPVFDLAELTYLGRANAGINLLVASKGSGIKSVDDLKAAKKSVRFAAFGFATPTVGIVTLGESLGIPIQLVNYRGPRETVVGTVRGDTELGMLGVRLWLKYIESGNVVPVAVWDGARDPRLPDVPTLEEIGAGELLPLSNHRSIAAPPNLPKDIRDKLIEGLRSALHSDEGIAFVEKAKFERNDMWGDEFAKILEDLQAVVAKHAAALREAAGK